MHKHLYIAALAAGSLFALPVHAQSLSNEPVSAHPGDSASGSGNHSGTMPMPAVQIPQTGNNVVHKINMHDLQKTPAGDNLSPEERAQLRERFKGRWDSMSPEQKQAAIAKIREHRATLTDAQKQQRRERIRERMAERRAHGGGRMGGGIARHGIARVAPGN